MDYYGRDHKLSDLGGVPQDLNDFLEQDVFTPPVTTMQDGMVPFDQDWLDNFLDDPVLNDRMMSDALQPNVRSEHSYSLSNGETATPDSPLNLKIENMEKDMEVDMISNTVNPNMTMSQSQVIINSNALTTTSQGTLDLSLKSPTHPPVATTTAPCTATVVKQEVDDIFTALTAAAATATPVLSKSYVPCSSTAVTLTRTPMQVHTAATTGAGQTLLKQPTIILATQQQQQQHALHSMQHHVKQERLVLPKVNIKVEPMDSSSNDSSPEHYSMYDSIGLPPTPPGSSSSASSSGSDSDGGLSPQRSVPSSPIRQSSLSRQHNPLMRSLSPTLSQPLFTSPIPTSGILILTEEEKRTLISEGYPIPGKLPLTKQEEKNLKKIRRKIKNKISAQESRRKKKEYLETLEKKVESYNQENNDLKKKVDHLENNNRSLLGQLHKLQSLVGKMRDASPSTTQTGTCLMVLVLCFAVFLGTWSPMSLSIGYRGFLSQSSLGGASGLSAPMAVPDSTPYVPVRSNGAPPMGPDIQDPVSDTYSTPNMKSRVLLSLREDREEPFGPHAPFSYRDFFMRWFSNSASCIDDSSPVEYNMMAPIPNVVESAAPLSFVESPEMVVANEQPENHTDKVMSPVAPPVQYMAQVMAVQGSVNTTA